MARQLRTPSTSKPSSQALLHPATIRLPTPTDRQLHPLSRNPTRATRCIPTVIIPTDATKILHRRCLATSLLRSRQCHQTWAAEDTACPRHSSPKRITICTAHRPLPLHTIPPPTEATSHIRLSPATAASSSAFTVSPMRPRLLPTRPDSSRLQDLLHQAADLPT
jgi:hypothetical protein